MIKNDKMLTSSNIFSEFTSKNTHTCRELLSNKNKHIFPEFISNITGTLRELFPNNTKNFSRHQAILKFLESYCQKYYTLFQSLHQTILTFPDGYWQTILNTFPEFIPNNTDILREFLPN